MDPGLPPNYEEAILGSSFHSTLLGILLLGIYTTVYLGTMYIYLTKQTSQSTMVITAISLLYLSNVADTGVQWFFLKKTVIANGETRDTAFAALSQIADGLLVWRCYHVWGKSFRVIFPSLVLVVAETALYPAIIIVASINNTDLSHSIRITLDNLTSAALFITFGATLLTTVLIAYQIYSVTRRDPLIGTTRPYRNIAEVLVQSAAAYSLVALLNALVIVVPETNTNMVAILNADNYSGALLLITAGMAPTIMVARVAMQASGRAEDVRTAHISDLEFRGHSRPSGNTSQILSHGLHAQVGGRDDEYSDGRDSEKRLGGPISASAEAPLEET